MERNVILLLLVNQGSLLKLSCLTLWISGDFKDYECFTSGPREGTGAVSLRGPGREAGPAQSRWLWRTEPTGGLGGVAAPFRLHSLQGAVGELALRNYPEFICVSPLWESPLNL